jgi:Tfp pilus assembly PilM family ATPase
MSPVWVRHTAIGLDLGRHAAKLVWAERRGRGIALTRRELLRLPPSRDSANVLRKWLESLHVRDLPCVVGLPGRCTILKTMDLPDEDPRSIRQAATMEVRKFRDLTSDDFVHDVAALPGTPGTRRALLVMARTDVLQPALSVPTDLGMDLVDVVPVAVALYNAMERFEMRDGQPAVCVDLGARGTEVAIGDRRGLQFARHFDIGTTTFAEAVAAARQTTLAQAEELLIGGQVRLDHAADAAGDALGRAVDGWTAELEVTLSLYRERFPADAARLVEIILSGGGAFLPGVGERLGRRTGKPVRRVQRLWPEAGNGQAAFTVAAGLALSGIRRSRVRVSLVPLPLQRALARRRNRRYAAAAAAALAAALVLAGVGRYRDGVRQRRQAEEDRVRRSRVEALQADVRQVRERSADLSAMLADVYSIALNGSRLFDLLDALADAKPPPDWFVEMGDASFYANEPYPSLQRAITNRPDAATAAPIPFRQFVLKGYTTEPTFYSVRSMLNALNRDPRVALAELLEEIPPAAGEAGVDKRWEPLEGVPFGIHVQVRDRLVPTAGGRAIPPTVLGDEEGLLERRLRTESVRHGRLTEQWDLVKKAFSTFKSPSEVLDVPAEEEAGLIDFRVALMETRKKLLEKAARSGTGLPSDLGLKEAAERDKSVRQLLYELATIRKLAELAVQPGVLEIGQIEPLPPVAHSATNGVFLEEYPVRMRMRSTYPALFSLIKQISQTKHFIALRQLQVRKVAVDAPEMVESSVVVASLAFLEAPAATGGSR